MTEALDRLSAALADRYRTERELGRGGMATVYLAQDIRHHRKVAIKVLRPELAAAIGAERFLSEIRTTANLQHPHILPLFDSGEADSFLFYVMPFIEGETLRDRLDREKQLPVADAVRVSTEVASAIDYAHRHGVIHRDIKPENILLHDGRALVADFGIALAASRAGGTRMTETGMSLGTPRYMSPEQAMGEREITAGTDVYALGCVTYEMLTGEPPFTGSSAQAVIARVVTESPRPLIPQRRTIPGHVEAAVLTALEKLPADRFATAAEFAAALTDDRVPPRAKAVRQAADGARAAAPNRVILVASLGAIAILAALAAWGWLRPTPPRPVLRYSMGIPVEQAMRQGIVGVNIAISPDGRRITYVGPGEGGDQLWVRDRDRLDATPLPGTAGAVNPVFSPDGTRIAFSAGPTFDLKVVPVIGGPPITVARAGNASAGGVAWSPDGWLYFDTPAGLSRVRAEGGDAELVAPLDSAAGEAGHAWPTAVPGGRAIVYRSRRNLDPADFDIVALDLGSGKRTVLAKALLARIVEPGLLITVRADGAVLGIPFDPEALRVTGAAVPLFNGVMTKAFGSADFAISASGTLVYAPALNSAASGDAEIVHVRRDGVVVPLDPPMRINPGPNRGLSLSPDGTRLALDIDVGGSTNIWIKQLPSGPLSRLASGTNVASRPTWTPDGRSIVYIDADSGFPAAWQQRADGSAAPELLWRVRGLPINEAVVSRDGEWLIYRIIEGGGNRNVYAVRPGRDTAPVPLLTGPFAEDAPALSPDGRWLAYTSDESGRTEIYVQPFPNTGSGRWQISTRGGLAARWSRSGRELFYESLDSDFMSVPITPGATFISGEPRRLFAMGGELVGSVVVPFFAPTPDDRQFVMARRVSMSQGPGAGQLIVVDNWFAELEQKLGRGAGDRE